MKILFLGDLFHSRVPELRWTPKSGHGVVKISYECQVLELRPRPKGCCGARGTCGLRCDCSSLRILLDNSSRLEMAAALIRKHQSAPLC